MSLSPVAAIVVCLLIGSGLLVGGVYLNWGAGFAMLAGALPMFGVAGVLARGLGA